MPRAASSLSSLIWIDQDRDLDLDLDPDLDPDLDLDPTGQSPYLDEGRREAVVLVALGQTVLRNLVEDTKTRSMGVA